MPRAKGFGKGSGRVVKVSSEDSKYVGRPGFRGFVQNVSNTTKAGVRRVMRNDPAVGITQPGADLITDTHIDLVGGLSPDISGDQIPTSFSSGRKTVKAAGNRIDKR